MSAMVHFVASADLSEAANRPSRIALDELERQVALPPRGEPNRCVSQEAISEWRPSCAPKAGRSTASASRS
jgi:hypothetical protein